MIQVRFVYTFLLIVSILCGVFLVRYSYKRRSISGANYFILLLITSILYNGTYIGELYASDFKMAKIWFDIEHMVIPLIHYFWVMMSVEYSRMSKKNLRIFKYAMLYHPIMYYIVYFIPNFHSLYIQSYSFESNGAFFVILTTKGSMYYAIVISGTILGLISTLVYLNGYMKASRFQRHVYIIMIAASFIPWMTVYLQATGSNYLGIDYFPGGTIVSGVLYMLGIFRFQIFNTIPIARDMVFRQSTEAILLLDMRKRIIDVNDSMIRLYPNLSKVNKKSTLTSFVNKHPELVELLENMESFIFESLDQRESKFYAVEVNKILAGENLQSGWIISIHDVTESYKSQKELEYMAIDAMNKAEASEMSFLQAQINPHFINNSLSVIASMITRAPSEAKILITDLGEYLANCYYFDSNSAMVLLEKEIETVETYVKIEKARFRERLKFQIVFENRPTIYVPRLVLQPLVENAIRHGILKKIEGGMVWMIIQCKEDRIYFEVRDNGVGMSEETVAGLTVNGDNKKSIGIMNIHKRLLKYYEEGLTITSQCGQGTSVSFFILFSKIIYKESEE